MSHDETPTEKIPEPGGQEPLSPLRRTIGNCRLRRVIASGGMGTLYEAVQQEPRRVVAVKVIKHGVTSLDALRRFRNEAQMLARLRHPNIMQVYEAGLHRDEIGDVPYFVMEYVPNARSITEYAAHRRLGLREKLALFATVCEAVDHGHRKGIIHRDLKPSNVLVDSAGQVKVIDFGVARATDADLAMTSVQTDVGQLVGTLQYMSPEQAEADPHAIDARSDVYTLGVVLYELLCGALPYVVARSSLVEATRVIREEAPTRLSSIDRALRGDVETIVLKAMDKDRARRYQSAEELRQDIVRYLADEPIVGRRPSIIDLLRRRGRAFARRHPAAALLLAAAAATVGVPLVMDPVFYTWIPLDAWVHRAITTGIDPAAPGGSFEEVRVITMRDAAAGEALAARLGLEGVRAGEITSLRRLYGHLMERLAAAGARVVAWDITFASETPFDLDFAAGARALRAAGAMAIVPVVRWPLAGEAPGVSPAILPEVRWAGIACNLDASVAWQINCVVQREPHDPMPGLALAAASALRRPGAGTALRLDERRGKVEVRSFTEAPWGRVLVDRAEIALSDVQRFRAPAPGDADVGHERGDLIGNLQVIVPGDDVLAAATIDMEDALTAAPARLREWFEGRAVVVGPLRSDRDEFSSPDGRVISGCYAHATGIDAILRTDSIRLPSPLHDLAMLPGAALLGILAVVAVARRSLRLALPLLALVLAAEIAASLVAYARVGYLCNPMIAMGVTIVAAVLAGAVVRARLEPGSRPGAA